MHSNESIFKKKIMIKRCINICIHVSHRKNYTLQNITIHNLGENAGTKIKGNVKPSYSN